YNATLLSVWRFARLAKVLTKRNACEELLGVGVCNRCVMRRPHQQRRQGPGRRAIRPQQDRTVLQVILDSASWRMTAPIRAVVDALTQMTARPARRRSVP